MIHGAAERRAPAGDGRTAVLASDAVALPLGLAGSLAFHAGLVALALASIHPNRSPPQHLPPAEVSVEAWQVARSEALERRPEPEAAATEAAGGALLAADAVPRARAEPRPPPVQPLAPATLPEAAQQARPPEAPALAAAPLPAEAPADLAPTTPPAAALPVPQAAAEALAPAPSPAVALAPPAQPGTALPPTPQPGAALPALAEAAAALPHSGAPAAVLPLPDQSAPATPVADLASIAPAAPARPIPAPGAVPRAQPVAAAALPALAAPAEAAPTSATPLAEASPQPVREAEARPARLAAAEPPAVAPAPLPAAGAPADPLPPPAAAAPSVAPAAQPADEAPPPLLAAAEARPEVIHGRAAAAPLGPDGTLDAQSLAALAAFMQPGEARGEAVRDGIEGILSAIPCARLQVEYDPGSGGLTLRGHVPSQDLGAPLLAALNQAVGAGIPVAGDLRVLPPPQCEALAGIAALGLPQSNDQSHNPRILGADSFAREFDYGADQPLSLEIQGADYPAWVYVDYFDAAGAVTHLIPNAEIPLRRLPPGAPLDALHARDGRGPLGIVFGPPYGQEIAVAFAASTPLYDGLRPLSEPAGPYLDFLRQRIAKARAQDPAFKGEWVYFFISTHP